MIITAVLYTSPDGQDRRVDMVLEQMRPVRRYRLVEAGRTVGWVTLSRGVWRAWLSNSAVIFGGSMERLRDNLAQYLSYEFQLPGTMTSFDVFRAGRDFVQVSLQ